MYSVDLIPLGYGYLKCWPILEIAIMLIVVAMLSNSIVCSKRVQQESAQQSAFTDL